MKNPQLHITVEFQMAQQLEDVAKAKGISVSELVRRLIAQGLKQLK